MQPEDGATNGIHQAASHSEHAQEPQQSAERATLNFQLQRVKSDELIEFPETADGYVSQVAGRLLISCSLFGMLFH